MHRGSWVNILILLLLVPGLTEAQVINEVFASPTTKQWIEIHNNTGADIDLSEYKILDAGAAVNGHGISAGSVGTILPTGEFGIVAKDLTSVSAQYVYKSALGIKTTGDTVILKKASSVLDTVQYTGGLTSGNSLQRLETGWSESAPTPGALNILIVQEASSSTVATTTASTTPREEPQHTPIQASAHYSFVVDTNDTNAKFTVSAGRDRLVATKQELVFKASANTQDQNILYSWNFGDGSTGSGREVKHSYGLAGEYNIVLNAILFDNDAISRARVKVIEPDLVVTESNSEYVSIRNRSKAEVNLYGWQLVGDKVFAFPKDTIISAGQMVKFPSSITQIYSKAILTRSGSSTQPAISSNAIVTSTSAHLHAEEIQKISDQLIELNNELAQLQNTKVATDFVQTETQTTIKESLPAAAAYSENTTWLQTLKRFFLGR